MALVGRTPTKEEREWMNTIQQLGCIVCRVHFNAETPAEIHHLSGKTDEDAHFKTIPLCHPHHRGGSGTGPFLSRHPYKRRWEERFGTEEELWLKVVELVGDNPLEG